MHDHSILRNGSLHDTVLNRIPGIKGLLSKLKLRIKETKWLSKSSLIHNGVALADGWSIHEEVEFL
jgi:hypothetical protein